MNSVESYPLIKHRLTSSFNIDIPFNSEVGHTIAQNGHINKINISHPKLKISTTKSLKTLLQHTCLLISKAKQTGNRTDITAVEKALLEVYDDYCYQELEHELNNLKKSLDLPHEIEKLEIMIGNSNGKLALLVKSLQRIQSLIQYYPEREDKQELVRRIKTSENTIKSLYPYEKIEALLNQLELNLQNIKGNKVVDNLEAYSLINDSLKSARILISHVLLSKSEKTKLKSHLQMITKANDRLDIQLVDMMNNNFCTEIIPVVTKRLSPEILEEVNDIIAFSDYFVQTHPRKMSDIEDFKQSIRQVASMYLINHASNKDMINRGLLLMEYSSYINLGRDRGLVSEEFYNHHKHELSKYDSFETVEKDLLIIMKEVTEKLAHIKKDRRYGKRSINNVEKSSDLNTLKVKTSSNTIKLTSIRMKEASDILIMI